MSLAGHHAHSERFPIFDGNDYPFWKQKMTIRLKAISEELWQIVENGYTIQFPESPTPTDERNIQLNAQAKDIICNYICKNIFIRFSRLEKAKQIWDALENVHEENQARRDAQVNMLQAMFTHFRSLQKGKRHGTH